VRERRELGAMQHLRCALGLRRGGAGGALRHTAGTAHPARQWSNDHQTRQYYKVINSLDSAGRAARAWRMAAQERMSWGERRSIAGRIGSSSRMSSHVSFIWKRERRYIE